MPFPCSHHRAQGCSTLWDNEHSEQFPDTCEAGTVAILAERVGAVGPENVEGEAAQADEHAGVGADARAILAQGDVPAVMGGVLDPPVRTDGLGGAGCGDLRAGDVEGRFGGMVQQPGLGVSGVNVALDPDDGGDVRLPIGVGQRAGGIEKGDGAAFVAVAAFVVAVGGPERRRGGRDLLDPLVQGRLVVFDADDQGDAGLCGGIERFFGSAAHQA